jgi:hypothetical protein
MQTSINNYFTQQEAFFPLRRQAIPSSALACCAPFFTGFRAPAGEVAVKMCESRLKARRYLNMGHSRERMAHAAAKLTAGLAGGLGFPGQGIYCPFGDLVPHLVARSPLGPRCCY